MNNPVYPKPKVLHGQILTL